MSAKDIEKIFNGPAGYAIAIAVGGIVLYALYSKAKTDALAAGQAVAGAVGGASPLQNSTNADGSRQTAYQGKGLLGTLGATVNNLLGGVPSSIGQSIGGGLYDFFNPAPPNPDGSAISRSQNSVQNNSPNIGSVGIPLDLSSSW